MLRTQWVGGWGGMLTFMWTCRSSWCYAHAGWGGGGWGGMLTFMWTCRSSWCYAHAGWGGGGMGWDVNVHVWTCRSSWCYAHAGWGGGGDGVGCQRSCELAEAVDATLTRTWTIYIYIYIWIYLQNSLDFFIYSSFFQYIYIYLYMNLHMCMMMMMTLMKLVNSATKFRHGIDKFYQPNSGLRGSKTWDEAIYIYIYIYSHLCTHITCFTYDLFTYTPYHVIHLQRQSHIYIWGIMIWYIVYIYMYIFIYIYVWYVLHRFAQGPLSQAGPELRVHPKWPGCLDQGPRTASHGACDVPLGSGWDLIRW